jgi:SAM-dependent methyltransferase
MPDHTLTILPNIHRACPVCGSALLSRPRFFQKDNLCRCKKCSLAFETRIPSDDELKRTYQVYSYRDLRPCPQATINSYNKVLHSFRKWKGNRRILDLGCGQGDFLAQAQAHGWIAKGLEYSESAVALCRKRGLDVMEGSLKSSGFANESFDIITAFEVLEHLRRPAELFQTASKLLNKGGLLYLTTPNFNALIRHFQRDSFYVLDYPGHLCIFTPKSLRQIAFHYDFRVAKLSSTGLDPLRLSQAVGIELSGRIPVTEGLNCVGSPSQSSQLADLDTLRNAIELNRVSKALKAATNSILSAVGIGETLKVWLVKT